MSIIGKLLKQGIKLRKSIEQDKKPPFELQKKQLWQLLNTAENTLFGKEYDFTSIINEFQNSNTENLKFFEKYKKQVPIFTYEEIYQKWWRLAREENLEDVAWKGAVKYYALSSGTSGSPSKYIPITRDMHKAINKSSIRQILALSNFKEIPAKVYSKNVLMLGGSTHLNNRGNYFEGDLSGITTGKIPFWFQRWAKPGKKISKESDWDIKLNEIARNADKWDIGYIAGQPAWVQIMMERIIEYYNLKNIHEIWPNLTAYAFGGVSIEPYRKGFERIVEKPLIYIETYMASEGFIAFQHAPEEDIRMVLNGGIFYEFIPFNEDNFDADGKLKQNPKTLMIHQIEEGKEYALLISTCAGAWRYLLGDTIKFTNQKNSEIIITGRTKHFLSICGEHLSVDNMNKAIENTSKSLNISIKEFAVAGFPYEGRSAHHWFIGTEDDISPEILKKELDENLKILNDDYRVERQEALKNLFIQKIPSTLFYKWLEKKGKIGGQVKFPRVLKKEQYQDWIAFLEAEAIDKS